MVFGIGRKDAQDVQDAQVPANVPYRLASYEHDHEGKRFKSSNVVYSFWSASKYVLILSLILWWLPMFGQMIAGYVGGRRAGGPWRGVAASILPVVCLYVVVTGFDSGFFPSHVLGVAIAPAAVSAVLHDSVPFISPYIDFSSEYLGSFVSALAGASPYGINTYVLTVAFAYVGGILAEQSRREIEFNSGAMMSNTTVLVSDGAQQPQMASHPYPAPAHHGLAHMIASAFPWSRHEHTGHPHAMNAHSQAAWAHAVPMRYDEGSEARVAAAMLPPAAMPENERAAPRRTRRSRSSHPKQTRGDPWVRAERRVTHTYTSAGRLAYDPESQYERGGGSRRNSPRIVPGDTRSIRRARKAIDSEWGRKRFPTLDESPSRHPRSRGNQLDVPGPEQPEAAHRAPRSTGNHWDSI